ncbi:TPA: hypothetical protein DDW35_07705 [Candidatus Sumerlaeota bacterium]|nr:hypothetical protein [Candidatus Sumerlaeota bacterium]
MLYTGSEKATLLRTLRRPELILRKKQKIWRPVQAFVLKHLLPFLKRTSVVDYRAIFLKEPSLRAFLEKAYPAGNPWFASAAIGDLFTQARQSPGNVGDSATFRLCGLLTLALYRKQLGWE